MEQQLPSKANEPSAAGGGGPRRTQFSSCDACRNSRLACDAARVGRDPGKPGWSGSCSRCARRKRRCTFEWMNNVTRTPVKGRRTSRATSNAVAETSQVGPSSPETLPRDSGYDDALTESDNPSRQLSHHMRRQSTDSTTAIMRSPPMTSINAPLDSVTASVGEWLERICESSFEMIFGFWMGRHCCPFVVEPDCDIILRPTRLYSELDDFIAEDWEAGMLGFANSPPSYRALRDQQIDQSLRHGMRSFAARWLHLIPATQRVGILQDDLVREYWRTSRRDMLKVINRVSYRSVLTLFLFCLTPIPNGISEEEELDGLTGQICVQAALQQVQRLRARQRNTQFNGEKVSPAADVLPSPPPNSTFTESFLRHESRGYWGALTFDTSASMTLNFRSSLSSGLHGFDAESCWRVLKMGAGSFHTRTEEWRRTFAMTEDEVLQVMAAAAAAKTYVWKMIAVLKEALREGYEDEKVLQAWTAFTEAVDIFRVTFRPLLNDCERRLPFLGQVERLNWYELMLHVYLGVLILVDALEAAERTDLLSQLAETRSEAEHEVLNALTFGLKSHYIIEEYDRSSGSTNPTSNNFQGTGSGTGMSITASFVALDPYPHHVVAAIQLMNKVVGREWRQGNIKLEAYKYLKSTLLKILEELPQSSKSVQAARKHLHSSLTELEPLPPERSSSTASGNNAQWWPAAS